MAPGGNGLVAGLLPGPQTRESEQQDQRNGQRNGSVASYGAHPHLSMYVMHSTIDAAGAQLTPRAKDNPVGTDQLPA
ncbi:MAG: hypothetical protein NVS3B26_09900 [Mycobacteriales bacterium]